MLEATPRRTSLDGLVIVSMPFPDVLPRAGGSADIEAALKLGVEVGCTSAYCPSVVAAPLLVLVAMSWCEQ
jgi:hypothetical protein